ncbi:MAG TPA: hypothetical protein VM935_19275, partial [Chitinophagaceae bacterium]|nr:hypothetical protein [Chitinophagaceae bacterium]
MTKTLIAKYLLFSFFTALLFVLSAKAGNFGEHKLIADSAFKKYCTTHPEFAALLKQLLGSEPLDINSPLIPLRNTDPLLFYRRDRYAGQYPLVVVNGKAVTYGDLAALSGDHSPDFIEAYRRFFNDGTFSSPGLFNNLFNDVLNQYDKELMNLDKGGTGYNPVFLEFIRLAAQDRSHFHIPAMPLRQEIDIVGQKTYDYATDLLYSGLTGDSFAARNREKMLAFFEVNCVAKYSILHTIAKTYYIHVFESLRDADLKQMQADKARNVGNVGAANIFQQAADLG